MRHLLALPLLFAGPAFAQDHATHDAHGPSHPMPMASDQPEDDGESKAQAPGEDTVTLDHRMMNHGAMEHEPMDHGSMQHGSMGHADMDHSGMGHDMTMQHGATATPSTDSIPKAPPPPEAFSGPLHAADQFLGEDVMAASREEVVREISGMPVFWFMADRAEYRARQGKDGYLWDVQAVYGGHVDKLWLKSEGEGSFGEKPESAEVQALWSHAIGPWWDVQAGVRQDLVGPSRTHAVVGIQGLAPYLFEVDASAFVSNKGDVTGRIEAELDQRITQRLILQPRAELNLAAQDIPELGVGAGLDRIEAGLRLRYQIRREFAPYVGIAQEWRVGQSADYAQAAGEDPSVTNFVAGVRFWF
ncbi:copper resistance protein B [Novosphingobium malaysiense]|uniref:Copper resistance protein CopB n=1 Tax=Novosphingobium malaysiense TaxID=1348853 RepID=A0A0B1ZM01_9SPHN|nr:copper resistance protein B [Novosphingobium malaysiense]KHK91566.1 copper resistance protein CopB [Novosphingobium malaysiense]